MGDDKSDIVLDQNWTRVINNFAITTEKGEDSDITLMPKWATINLGGGGGSNSDGDLKWHNKDGDRLIHFSAEGGEAFDDTRIYAVGEHAALRLGGAGRGGRVEIHDGNGNEIAELGSRSGTKGYIRLDGDGDSDGTTILPHIMYGEKIFGDSIEVTDSMTASSGLIHDLELGGGAPGEEIYSPGTLTVWDDEGNDAVTIDGETGSVQFSDVDTTDGERAEPMMTMFESDTSNPPRSIVAHSPTYSDWGLLYEDVDDKMIFEGGGSPVLTADLGNEKVGIGTDEPKHELHVEGTAKGTTEWAKISDARCKQNVQPLSGALDTVQQLQGVSYEWDEEWATERTVEDDRQVGFVAQEVEEVLPEAVLEDEDGLRATTQGAVTPVLVEAVKEQQHVIDEQRETIDHQQETIDEQAERVGELEERLERLEAAVSNRHEE